MKKICMVAYTYYLSDPRVRREAEALAERGDMVDFICLREKGGKSFGIVNGVNLYRLPQGRYRGSGVFAYVMGYFLFFIRSFLKLNSLYFKKKYNLIHINTMPDFLVFTAIIPKILGTKVILDIHDLMPELYAAKFAINASYPLIQILCFIEKISTQFADHVLTVTKLWKGRLQERSVRSAKCSVILNVPDDKIFKIINKKRDNKYFNLIYHGTIAKRYGIDVAIKAINIIKDEIPSIRFTILGEGDQLEEFINLTRKLSLENYIYFSKQFVPVEKLPTIIAQMDIGVVPNRNNEFAGEVLNGKLLEYVAMRIPVIVSKTIGIQQYFNDSMVMFFEPENVKDIARKILYLYRHPEERRKLIQNADKFNQKHNWRKEKQKYYEIVDRLIRR